MNKDKIDWYDSSVNFGNHRYTNEQNCILFICKCDLKKVCTASAQNPPPQSHNRSYGLESHLYSS